jgi:hypothetical protein
MATYYSRFYRLRETTSSFFLPFSFIFCYIYDEPTIFPAIYITGSRFIPHPALSKRDIGKDIVNLVWRGSVRERGHCPLLPHPFLTFIILLGSY